MYHVLFFIPSTLSLIPDTTFRIHHTPNTHTNTHTIHTIFHFSLDYTSYTLIQ